MAALVLSAAGAAAGKSVFGPAGAIAGRLIGAIAGSAIDRALFASRREISQEGPRLADLEVMASTEGAPIPRVYGRARLSGQVIWATNLEEVVSTTSQTTGATGGKGMGGAPAVGDRRLRGNARCGEPPDHVFEHGVFPAMEMGGAGGVDHQSVRRIGGGDRRVMLKGPEREPVEGFRVGRRFRIPHDESRHNSLRLGRGHANA